MAIQAKLAAAAEVQATTAMTTANRAEASVGAETEAGAGADAEAEAEAPTADPAAEAEARRLKSEVEDAMLRRRLGLTSTKR